MSRNTGQAKNEITLALSHFFMVKASALAAGKKPDLSENEQTHSENRKKIASLTNSHVKSVKKLEGTVKQELKGRFI